MGTVGGEPRFLLNALKPMLGIYGDIKTPQEVLRVVNLMKDAEKLMSRCIYLNVLRATCSQSKNTEAHVDTLERFLSSGGWGILNKWLNEYTKSENGPLLVELLEVLRFLPVTIEILKQGNTGKIIKLLTKFDDPDVRKGAMKLIKQWKGMIRGGNNEKGPKSNSTDMTKRGGEDSPGGAGKRARQGSTDEKLPPEKKAKQSDEKKDQKKEKEKVLDSKAVAVESFGFMNAIVSIAKPVKKKKKLASPKTTLPLDEILSNKNLDGDKNADPPYSSPMREDQDSKDKVMDTNGEGNNSDQSQKTESKDTNGEKMDESSNDSSQPSKKKKKKSITWAEDDNLTKIFYFELDEEERAAMHHTVNFITAKHNELIREREALESARRTGEDRMVEKVAWRRPGVVEMTSLPVEPGEKSREKYIQKEREQKVLADIFLTKASLPDSPAEPDNDNEEHGPSDPKLIPHDEEGTFYPKPSIPLQQQQQPQSSLSLSSATSSSQSTNDTNAKGNGSSLLGDPPAEMIANMKDKDMSPAVHNIMKKIMVGPGSPQDYPRPGGPDFMGRGGRPMGPDGFGGPHRFPLRGGPRQPMMPYQGRPRGNFRGRPMAPRGGPMRPRFHGPPMGGMQGGNEEHYDGYHEEEQHYRGGRGRGRGGPPPRGRGKREPPMCRHYMTTMGCRNGNNCHFLHPSKNGPSR